MKRLSVVLMAMVTGTVVLAARERSFRLSNGEVVRAKEVRQGRDYSYITTTDGRAYRIKKSRSGLTPNARAMPGAKTKSFSTPTASTSTTSASVSTVGGAAPVSTTSVSAIAASVEPPKSPWSASLYTEVSASRSDFEQQTGKASTYFAPSFKYKTSSGTSLGITPQLAGSYNMELGNTKTDLADLVFQVSRGELFKLGPNSVSGGVRYGFPMGYSSHFAGHNGMLRADLGVPLQITEAFGFSYSLSPRYWLNNTRSGARFDEDGRPKIKAGKANVKANREFRLITGLDANFQASEAFGITFGVGYDHITTLGEPEFDIERGESRTLSVGPSFSLSVGKASFGFGISQDYDLDSEEKFKAFNKAEIGYVLSAGLSL